MDSAGGMEWGGMGGIFLLNYVDVEEFFIYKWEGMV